MKNNFDITNSTKILTEAVATLENYLDIINDTHGSLDIIAGNKQSVVILNNCISVLRSLCDEADAIGLLD